MRNTEMNDVEHFWSISFFKKNNLLSSEICKGKLSIVSVLYI